MRATNIGAADSKNYETLILQGCSKITISYNMIRIYVTRYVLQIPLGLDIGS
jgi:hypothetical protein